MREQTARGLSIATICASLAVLSGFLFDRIFIWAPGAAGLAVLLPAQLGALTWIYARPSMPEQAARLPRYHLIAATLGVVAVGVFLWLSLTGDPAHLPW